MHGCIATSGGGRCQPVLAQASANVSTKRRRPGFIPVDNLFLVAPGHHAVKRSGDIRCATVGPCPANSPASQAAVKSSPPPPPSSAFTKSVKIKGPLYQRRLFRRPPSAAAPGPPPSAPGGQALPSNKDQPRLKTSTTRTFGTLRLTAAMIFFGSHPKTNPLANGYNTHEY